MQRAFGKRNSPAIRTSILRCFFFVSLSMNFRSDSSFSRRSHLFVGPKINNEKACVVLPGFTLVFCLPPMLALAALDRATPLALTRASHVVRAEAFETIRSLAEPKLGRARSEARTSALVLGAGCLLAQGLCSQSRSSMFIRSWSRRRLATVACSAHRRPHDAKDAKASRMARMTCCDEAPTQSPQERTLPEMTSETGILRPLPQRIRNDIGKFDTGRYANPNALEGEAYYLPGLNCRPDDRSVFQRLMLELDFKDCWLETGMKFSRQICIGDAETLAKAPTYRSIVERVSKVFGVRVVRTLVNLYRDGRDWCNLHSDQYHQGGYPIDLTVGATFGDPRRLLWVEKRNTRHKIELPQRNGDVFAFSDKINTTWRHMIPEEGPECGPRISVIVWCDRQESSNWLGSLGSFPHMLYHNPRGRGQDFKAKPQNRRAASSPILGPEQLLPEELEDALTNAKKAITLQGAQQVFAILRGIKLIENRTWAIPRGWYALHAGAQMINEERAQRTRKAWPEAPPEEELPHGAIAGLIYIDQNCKPRDCRKGYIWARGPICNVISRAVELPKPVRCRGDRGLWELRSSLKVRIRSELLRAGSCCEVKHFDLTPALGRADDSRCG